MGKLTECNDCSKQISKNAKTCPYCGAKVPRVSGCTVLFFGAVMFMIFAFTFLLERDVYSDAPAAGTSVAVAEPLSELAIKAQAVAAVDIVIEAWSWQVEHGYATVEGLCTNVRSSSIENVEVMVNFTDEDGKFITAESSLVKYRPLLAKQETYFEVLKSHNPKMRSASISFKELRGRKLVAMKREDYDALYAEYEALKRVELSK